jgi:putative DNA primase/helicase
VRLSIATAAKHNSLHWDADDISWDELCEWARNPADVRESGGYLLGKLRPTTVQHPRRAEPCTELHRRKDAVVSRSGLALDADTPDRGFRELVELTLPYAAILHPTWSYAPDAPRYRLLIPLDREVLPDEYVACCEAVMQMFGAQHWDLSTTQPERFMFRPATQNPDWYDPLILEGPPASADALLAHWDRDLSLKPLPAPGKNKRDPFGLEGVIGAFNRAYEDWDLLIETYDLPYTRVSDDRYQLVGSVAEAGMGPIPDTGFVYSHHANDPAYGQTCSAFDLVRLHRFASLDEDCKPQTPITKRPSQLATLDLVGPDPRVTAELVGVVWDQAMDAEIITPDEWKLGLRRAQRTGKFVDCVQNWDLVKENDPVFRSLYYNELSLSPEVDADLPWRLIKTSPVISSNDRWEFVHYVERAYGIRVSETYMSALINNQAWQRVVNPVRDYLTELVWDKVPRVETCLPGVRPTSYTRMVARKVMVAAVARMFQPGCKWDHVPVLVGNEGIGKTHFVDRIFRGFSAALGRIDNKDTMLICQRSWVVTADENHSMRKSDQDAQKEFLTRTSDVFRMPYDRETLAHPRHWVVWSTTNDRTFLTRQQGNRRFLVLDCEDSVDFDRLTDAYVDQLWAEAVYLYRAGEKLYLNADESALAARHRDPFVEEDALEGLILDYLETQVPADWWRRRPESRQQWLFDRAAGFENEGSLRIDTVCSMQIWVEALNRRKGDARRADLIDITGILKRLPGWRELPGRVRVPGYGSQLSFIRDELL